MKNKNNDPADERQKGQQEAETNKNSEKEFADNGQTIAPMDAEWMPWNIGKSDPRKKARADMRRRRKESTDEKDALKISKEERRAMIRGALSASLPILIGFAVVGVLLYMFARFWLMP